MRLLRKLITALFFAVVLTPVAAHAQLVATVDGPQTAAPGAVGVTFTGTITNTSLTDTYVLSYGSIDGFTQDPSGGAGDVFLSGLFFPTDPASFAPAPDPSSQYGPGPLFSVDVASQAPTGLYSGIFGIFGSSSSDPTVRELTTVNFDVNVTNAAAAPEPSGLLVAALMAGGTGVLLFLRRRAGRASLD